MRLETTISAGRLLGLTRLGWAALLLVKPDRAVTMLGGPVSSRSREVARVAGGRHLVQGAAELVSWPCCWRLGVFTDLAHASTGVGLALHGGSWRRMAVRDAALAGCFAVWGILARPQRG